MADIEKPVRPVPVRSVRTVRYRAGVPVYRYRTTPDIPPVSVMRFDPHAPPGHGQRHIHDFPVLVYVERAMHTAHTAHTAYTTSSGPPDPVRDGDAYVLAAGAVVDPAVLGSVAAGVGVYFDPAALGGDGQAPWSSWRSHPLLFPFLHGTAGGLLRLHVPPERQPVWSSTISAIESELAGRAEGYRQAALAHLTLLLVDVTRLAADIVGDLRRGNETLLAAVFDVIERRFAEPLSLRDVADSIGVTPGYLTTLVRRRTGRTVVDWITEHRMVRARGLLAETDLPVAEIARRVGLADPGYFARIFKQSNSVTPREWRRNAAPISAVPVAAVPIAAEPITAAPIASIAPITAVPSLSSPIVAVGG